MTYDFPIAQTAGIDVWVMYHLTRYNKVFYMILMWIMPSGCLLLVHLVALSLADVAL